MVFFDIVFPVFASITIGYILGKAANLDIRSSSRMALYVFSPALFFNSMLTSKIDNDELLKIISYAILLFLLFTVLVYLFCRIFGYSKQLRSSLLLSSSFPNSGNYGLPIILYAFSQAGFDRAIIFSVFQSLLMNSAGVYFASNSNKNFLNSLKEVLKMPGFIAIIVAVIMRGINVSLPDFLLKPIQLLGQASIPTLLIILGIQLSKVKKVPDLKFISIATSLKMFIYPLIGFMILPLFFDMTSLTAKVMLIVSSLPSAATPTILAIEFDSKPELVSAVTLITTIVSLFTVSILLSFLV